MKTIKMTRLWGIALAVALGGHGCSGCRKSQDVQVMREAEAVRLLALDAHRRGEAEAAIESYRKAEKLLDSVARSTSPLAKGALSLLEACQLDRAAAESPTGVAAAVVHYIPKSEQASWDILANMSRSAQEVLGQDVWSQLSETRKAAMVKFLTEGGVQFFTESSNPLSAAKHRFSEAEIQGNEATVRVTSEFMNRQVDSVCRLVRYGMIWQMYDVHCETLNAGFCQMIRATMDVIGKEQSLESFLDSPDAKDRFAMAWREATGNVSKRLENSYQGRTVEVIAPGGAKIVSGDMDLGMAPKGTHFKVLQERDEKWLLMNFEQNGVATLGWVEKDGVQLAGSPSENGG